MHFIRTCFASLVAFTLIALLAARADESPVGTATSVIPAASYARGTQVASLEINGTVEQNDRVKISGKGSTQIKFVDGTLLTIGPNSEVLLDKMIFDGRPGEERDGAARARHHAVRHRPSEHGSYHVQTRVRGHRRARHGDRSLV